MHALLNNARRIARRLMNYNTDQYTKQQNQAKLQAGGDHIRWGILSTGRIAAKLAHAIALLDDGVVTAVGSRSQRSADAFGDRFGIPTRHASYEALAADPNVDVIYVATPHNYHMDNTLTSLAGGKAVLCEKPFAMNAAQSQRMVAEARQRDLFLMEAMWTRFIPAIVNVRELLADGVLGELQSFEATFSFAVPIFDPKDRLFNKDLAGGALLDVGIYPLSFAAMVFGTNPTRIESSATIGSTGVDERNEGVLHFEGGKQARWISGLRENLPCTAVITGENGTLTLADRFFHTDRLTLQVGDQPAEEIHMPYGGNGFEFQAKAVQDALRAGHKESPIMPLDESVAIMAILDQIRGQWGLSYDGEHDIPA